MLSASAIGDFYRPRPLPQRAINWLWITLYRGV